MKPKPHRRLFSHSPLAQLAVAYSVGILFSHYSHLSLSLALILCTLCSITSLLAIAKQRLAMASLSLLLAIFFAGAVLFTLERRSADSSDLKLLIINKVITRDDRVEVTGRLDSPPEFSRERVYLTLRVEMVGLKDGQRQSSGVVALLGSFQAPGSEQEYRELQLHYGARIRVRTTLNRTDKYRNPGVSTLTEYLDRKGYDATAYLKSPGLITRLNDAPVFPPLAWLYHWRDWLQHEIDARFSTETAGVLDAALLGNRYNLSQATAERFRAGGTFHVLVISGLHISFIGGVVFLVVRWLTKNSLLRFVLSTLVVWSYTIAVGGEASVVRAALMFTFVTFAAVVFRSSSSLNALGGSALVLLVRSPEEIFDPSLQLTYLSVFAIVVIAWPILQSLSAIGTWRPTRHSPYPPRCSRSLRGFAEALFWSELDWKKEIEGSAHHYRLFKAPAALWLERHRLQRCARYMFGAVVVSVSVQLVLLPLLIVYFHRVSLASVFLNIGVSVMLAALAVIALAALLVAQISSVLATPLVQLANAIDWTMVHSVDPFSNLGIASLRVPEYSGWGQAISLLYYHSLLPLVVMLSRWQPLAPPSAKGDQRNKKVGLAVLVYLALLALVGLHPLSVSRPDGNLHVDFLDVGQGDAVLVTMPDGTTLLVDGGGRPNFLNGPTKGERSEEPFERETRSIGDAVVSEYLWWKGLSRVDYVLATHAHADHIDGLNDIVRNFAVRSALVARTPLNDQEYSKFAGTLAGTKTPVEVIQAGDVLLFGGVEAQVLWPPGEVGVNSASGNNDSIVLRLQFGERAILLTGDVEASAENALIGSPERLRVDVVKVPHHGSRTSSTEGFVNATQAALAIVSVGQTSIFGHPHKEAIERWQANGAEVLTTGKSGLISVTTDGKSVTVKRFVPL